MLRIRANRALLGALLVGASSATLATGCIPSDGDDGVDGTAGSPGAPGAPGQPGTPLVDPNAPLSAMVAVTFQDDNGIQGETGETPTNVADYVKALVHLYTTQDPAIDGFQFPLTAAATDSVRALKGLHVNVVTKWLDPLTFSTEMDAPRFGANADYIAYFGEGWEDEGGAPQFAGSDTAAWVWVNHEYVSNDMPTATSAPVGQHLTLSQFARYMGILVNDIYADTWDSTALAEYINLYKKQLGGSWMRIIQDPATGEWSVDRSAGSIRYDATSSTLLTLSGISQSELDHDDEGATLPEGVIVGIMGDCSGGQTPWGTVITAEENVQDYYGDLETAWDGNQKFVTGSGFDPGGMISFPFAASDSADFSRSPDPNAAHNRDFYSYLAEIDVGQPSDVYDGKDEAGIGHKKLGAIGRARWENATFVVGEDLQLVSGQPIVLYAGNDRRSGRVYKYVSSQPFMTGMSKAATRALLDDGTLYVAHFEDLDNATGTTLAAGGAAPTEANQGTGRWIELSLTSADIAPNAAALGDATRTVGEALADPSWNGIGGFATEDDVLWALFTAGNKLGVRELNRPEDLEWNPKDPSGVPRLYVAFTNHTGKVALDQDGVLFDPEQHDEMSPQREDRDGAIVAIEEADPANPSASSTFSFFEVWAGRNGSGDFDAADPDNIMIDADGGVWFGTDGNFSRNGHADALYYLDLDDSHRTTAQPTYGQAFRVVAGPSDAEATGPALSAGMGTLFFSVQHPGERSPSNWPPR